MLGKAHARVGRHLEGAELHEAETTGRAIGRIELVDADFRAMGVAGNIHQKVAVQAIHQPEREILLAGLWGQAEGDFQLVQ